MSYRTYVGLWHRRKVIQSRVMSAWLNAVGKALKKGE